MNKKFIYFKTKTQFTAKLSSLPNNAIVFIEDTKQIWTHGVFFDTSWDYVGDKPDTYTPSAHSHGPITNDGKIGTLANRIIETTTGGLLTHVAKNTAYNKAFGTGKNQVARGNHTHKYITATRYDTGDPKPNELVQGLSFQFSYPDGGWHNAINMKSYRDPNYLSTQIVSSANNPGADTGYSYSLRYREGRNETWLGWKTIYDSANLLNFTRTVAGLVPAPGAATTTRYLREDGTWVIPPDTHWTTGIRAGASGTNANSVADNPFIKVLDNTTYRSQIQILGGTNITAKSDATGKITIDGTHNHTLKLIAGASTATTNSTADVANPYIRLFSDNVHQGNIQIVGGTNVGAVSKNGTITLTATDTTYSAGNYITMASGNKITGNYGLLTKALLDGGKDATYRVTTAAQMHAWIEGKNFSTESFVNNAIAGLEIGGRNLFTKEILNSGFNEDSSSFVVGGSGNPNGFKVTGGNNGELGYVQFDNVIKSNGTYTVSFKMRGSQNAKLRVVVNLAGQISPFLYAPEANVFGDSISYTFTVNNYVDGDNGYLRFQKLRWVYYFFDDIKLEKGNKPTDWSPAPEDQVSDWLTTDVNSFSFIKNKPTTFTPSAHTHNASDINAGVLGIARIPTGTTLSTVALGNHIHTDYVKKSGDIMSGGLETPGINVGTNSNTSGYGISLYKTTNGWGSETTLPIYGLAFSGTAAFEKHGGVQGDWATYFTMDGATNRGWIFRHRSGAVSSNVASISSSGVITAPTFIGALSGNATSATKLSSNRTYALTGDVTGSVSNDLTSGFSIATTLANSGVSAGTYRSVTVDVKGRVTAGTNPTTLSGYGITDGVQINSANWANFRYTAITEVNKDVVENVSGSLKLDGWYSLNVGATSVHGTRLTIAGLSAHDKTQLYFNGTNGSIQYRKSWWNNTAWTALRTIWDSNNLTSLSQLTDNIGVATHIADNVKHITAAERTKWNATNANILNRRGDNRGGFKPSDITSGALITTFSTQGALLSQTNNSDYVDVIGLSTYLDSSAGQVNALAFDKSSHRITHFMGTFGTSSWSSNKTLAYTDGYGASGTWGINITGNAATATALTTSAGSTTQPVYFSGGKPVVTTYSLGKSVPSNAIFTDTKYNNFTKTVAGLVPAPTGSTSTRFLREDGQWHIPSSTEYTAGTGISLNNKTFNLNTATASALGGVKLFDDTIQSGTSKVYGVQLNSSGQMVVNVPWTDTNTNTTYSAGTGLSLSGTTFNVNYGITSGTAAQGNDSRINNGQTAHGWGNHASAGYLTSIPLASTSNIGGGYLVNNTKANVTLSRTTTANRYYPVQLNTSNQMMVNVPWTDTTSSYTLPTASASTLGGIKVGANLSINSSTGVLSATDTKYSAGSNISISGSNVISATNTTYNVFTRTIDGLVPKSGGSTTTRYLREDGTWVTPPNTDTTYTAGTGLTLSGTQFSLPITVSGSGTYVRSIAHDTNGNGISVTLGTPPNTNTTYSSMSVAEGQAGTATTSRTVRADYLKQIIQHYAGDTNSVTGIRAGASETITNATVSNPYIKVIDDSTYRDQIRLIGGGATTVKSDASGNVTISSPNKTYTTGTLLQLFQGTNDVGMLQSAKNLNKWLGDKFQVVTSLPTSPTAGVFYFIKE